MKSLILGPQANIMELTSCSSVISVFPLRGRRSLGLGSQKARGMDGKLWEVSWGQRKWCCRKFGWVRGTEVPAGSSVRRFDNVKARSGFQFTKSCTGVVRKEIRGENGRLTSSRKWEVLVLSFLPHDLSWAISLHHWRAGGRAEA